ncbi:export cytoplasm protein SecA ATPase RNA helicase [Photobacterium leiognathi lrivu.4.1]|uniref:Export cytoplasm protein SecA ATPase RNA helicase n=1 Tax=Photobacterium leiognathi lrivu.4.1 TaxID=1248232 RepID=X0P7Q1_PHOLE|nr:SEC-C metal-binding domain-containing protein [Photobacterium leiognathi]GAD28938.1 export cytoplasm protein SecA ATPase RNA helicase [Photobacterium leiognathi lrivu.4.1]
MNTLMTLPSDWDGMPASFIEGALFAANANPKPMEPEIWLPVLAGSTVDGEAVMPSDEDKVAVLNHFEMQYRTVKAGEYQLPTELQWQENGEANAVLAEFAKGFLTVWQYIEPNWEAQIASDGTMRMLSALLTTLMLCVDEAGTLEQMEQAGFMGMPAPSELYPQLPLMLTEVMMAADQLQIGAGAQAINPYKNVGRNDPCPCESGKKFKQCCGKSA